MTSKLSKASTDACKLTHNQVILSIQSVYGSRDFIPLMVHPNRYLAPTGYQRFWFAYNSALSIVLTAFMLMNYVQNSHYDTWWSDFVYYVVRWVGLGMSLGALLPAIASLPSKSHFSPKPAEGDKVKGSKALVSTTNAGELKERIEAWQMLEALRWELYNRMAAYNWNQILLQTLLMVGWWFIRNASGSPAGGFVNYLGGPPTFISTQATANQTEIAFLGAIDVCLEGILASIWFGTMLWAFRNNGIAQKLADKAGQVSVSCDDEE